MVERKKVKRRRESEKEAKGKPITRPTISSLKHTTRVRLYRPSGDISGKRIDRSWIDNIEREWNELTYTRE